MSRVDSSRSWGSGKCFPRDAGVDPGAIGAFPTFDGPVRGAVDEGDVGVAGLGRVRGIQILENYSGRRNCGPSKSMRLSDSAR